MNKLINLFCRALEWVMVALLATMVLLVFGNVVLRYAFSSGITVSEELSRWLFVWMCFLGAIVAVKEQAHLGTDMLVARLGRRGQRVCLVLVQLAMLGINGLLLQGAWQQMVINLEVEAPVTGLSMGIFYASGVVFAIFAGLLVLRALWRTVTGQLRDDELVAVQESEDMAQVNELHLDRSGTYKNR